MDKMKQQGHEEEAWSGNGNGNGIFVVNPQFCAPFNGVELLLQKDPHSLTGFDYTVKDVKGKLVFKFEGALGSHDNARIMRDSAGNALMTIRRKALDYGNTWEALKGANRDARNLFFSAHKSYNPPILRQKYCVEVSLYSIPCCCCCSFTYPLLYPCCHCCSAVSPVTAVGSAIFLLLLLCYVPCYCC
eukprot:Gb_06794 [translate_table: standard]